MQRIAFLLQSMAGGGAERVTCALANGMRARGVTVDVVLLRAEGALLGDLSPDIELVDLNARLATSPPKIARYLRQRGPDVLIPVMYDTTTAAFWGRALSRSRTPIIGTLHSPLGSARYLPGRPVRARHDQRTVSQVPGDPEVRHRHPATAPATGLPFMTSCPRRQNPLVGCACAYKVGFMVKEP